MQRNSDGLVATAPKTPTSKAAANTSLSRPFSATERAVWLGFLATHLQLLRRLDHELMEAERMPTSSFEVLLTIAEAPEGRMRMKDIAAHLLISRSGLTRIVDELQRQGLVERQKCPDDARGLDAVLTPAGRKTYRRELKIHRTSLRQEFLGKLSEEQLTQLSEIWDTVGLAKTVGNC